MGSFAGHLIPGVFFVSFALWWTVHIWLRYWKASLGCGINSYRNSATYSIRFCCCENRSLPIEGFFKITFTAIGIIAERSAFTEGTGFLANLNNTEHMIMYGMFLINGVIDILLHFEVLPKNLDYYSGFLAIVVEGILFKFHLQGRSELDVQIHTLLVYVIFACAFAMLFELRCQNSFLAGFSRAFLMMLQGTWFIQMAFILYNPIPGGSPWKNGYRSLTLSTIAFTLHMMGVFVVMLALGRVIKCFTNFGVKTSNKNGNGQRVEMQNLLQDETSE